MAWSWDTGRTVNDNEQWWEYSAENFGIVLFESGKAYVYFDEIPEAIALDFDYDPAKVRAVLERAFS